VEAERSANTALERSGALDRDDQSRFYALWHAGMAYVLLRNAARVAAIDSELMNLANDRGLPYWQALAHFLRGWRVSCAGHATTAAELFHSGFELWAKTGSRIFRPIFLAFLADAHAAADQPDLADQRFREALRIAAGTGERWAEPEIHRLYGDLLARCGNQAAAIGRYKRALDLAHEQGSRWFELRTATSLARLVSEQGRRAEAHDLLLNVYQSVDARGATPDVTDARMLIEAGR
jgi:predicted ATPase